MKEIYEMKGAGRSIREIARELDVSRNTVRKYLKSPEAMRPKLWPPRGSQLDPYTDYIDLRMGEGLENCRVLDREIHAWAIRVATRRWCSTYARGGDGVSRRRRCGLRRRRESRPKWTGEAWHTSARTGSSAASGCS